MLTDTDLAIVRAALHFLDEEFSPNEDELFKHYLNDEGLLAGASTAHIKTTREKFESATLHTVLKQPGQNRLASTKMIRSNDAEEIPLQGNQGVPVSVIITAH